MKILIVDDEQVALNSVRRLLKRRGWRDTEVCDNGAQAIELIKEKDFDLILLDLLMPEIDGLQVLKETKPFKPHSEFIMVTALDDVASAIKAIRLGAYDYLVKPVDNERLLLSMERAYEHRGLIGGLFSGKREIPEAFSEIVTQDARMLELFSFAHIMARSDAHILITGESGTGKELMARSIHRSSPCAEGPFVAVNISSVPETLFESQFFGHRKGAFTGADRDCTGYFEQANGGTLFLDEVGELALPLQVKLLRVLEEKLVTPVGETKPRPVNARILSATNRDLDRACREGRFRLDFLYRLKSVHIHLPPLRERGEDITLLASHLLNRATSQHRKEVTGFAPEVLEILKNEDFPGNVRELEHLINRAVLLVESDIILPRHLGKSAPPVHSFARKLCSLKENDETHLAYVLAHTGGNRSEAARILGVTVRQVQRKVAQMKKNPRWENVVDNFSG